MKMRRSIIIITILLIVTIPFILYKIKYSDELRNLKFLNRQNIGKKLIGEIVSPKEITRVSGSYFDSISGHYHKTHVLWRYKLPSYFGDPNGFLQLSSDSTVLKLKIGENIFE